MHTSGMLEAERKGFDLRADVQVLELGEDGAEEHLRQHALRNFADYGNDIPSRGRMRRDDDPHVAVDPVERGVPPELLVPEVRAWLEEQVPLEWPPREELGMEKYSRVMDLVVTLLTNAV
ncbi:hypothetical protein A4X03_0g7463 [Tilletia caries]|uniref:Uncharacterized protein n=1 Tax=Tilletia caries TaxID=13290 RepID=A0A8T8SQN9_9BASI|nr:hypothetical protein CF335_g7558 [Tilletia laevis]KAE8245642.1 hypothetical protein A4X03_0g7463 [Tilletia caries]